MTDYHSPPCGHGFGLTLAFLFVGLIGAVLVAVFVGVRTQREFDQFINDRYRQDMVQELADYDIQHDGWQDISAIALRTRVASCAAPVALVDTSQTVLLGTRRDRVGEVSSNADLRRASPIEVDGQVVGELLIDATADSQQRRPNPPRPSFWAASIKPLFSARLGATIIALALGFLLARRHFPFHSRLTVATQRVSQGDLGHEVPVRTDDELDQLAASFNQISTDLATSNQLRRR